jgi:hypothetical protein
MDNDSLVEISFNHRDVSETKIHAEKSGAANQTTHIFGGDQLVILTGLPIITSVGFLNPS